MTTLELAELWGISVEETVKKAKKAGVYILDPQDNLDSYAIRNIEDAYGPIKHRIDPVPDPTPDPNYESKPIKRPVQESETVETCAQKYYTILHSSSLVSPPGGEFIEKLAKLGQKYHHKPIVTESTMIAISDLYHGATDDLLRNRARSVLMRLKRLTENDLILIIPGSSYSERDIILSIIRNSISQTDLLILTQDESLMKDSGIKIGSDSKSGHTLRVQKISNEGKLVSVFYMENGRSTSFRFPKADRITTLSSEPMDVRPIPALGEKVYSKSGTEYVLSIQCGRPGTEGTVYKVSDKYAAKIYRQDIMNPRRLKKLERMAAVSDHFCRDGICWPCEILYNRQAKPVGYLMPLAVAPKGKKLYELYTATNYTLLQQAFPTWKRENIIKLCITVLDKMVFLHNANVIMGDINTRNFLFSDDSTVFFVDCDSYQISDIPCPVGVDEYIAPEIQLSGGRYDILRTMANENFAVATLIFMLLMAGKRPYDLTDGEGVVRNIINADFAYPLGEDSNGRAPVGPYRYIWSNMPRFLKSMFYYTFRNPSKGIPEPEKSTYAPEKRPSSLDWKRSLSYYLKKLPVMIENDSKANLLVPGAFKDVTKRCTRCGEEVSARFLDTQGVCRDCRENTVVCKLCGMRKKAPAKYKHLSICQDCLDIEETYHCASCGAELTYSNFQKYVHPEKPKYKFCRACAEKRNTVYVTKTCTSCGKRFKITYGERDYYESKGFDLPKRCEDCRKNRSSSHSSSGNAEPATTSISYNIGKGNKGSSKNFVDWIKGLFG